MCGMTLTEVMIALCVLALAMGGTFAALMQSRRLTEGSIGQNSALTIVQGYVEQMKNMELTELVGGSDGKGNPVLNTASYSIPTRLDESHTDPLLTSTGSPPALSSITPGVTPSGVVDNLKNVDMIRDSSSTSSYSADTTGAATTVQVPWNTAWPGASTFPAGNVGATDLKINIWVWVSDLSTSAAQRVYGVTLIYTSQYTDGGKVKYQLGTVRTIRSVVPTY
jgi:Tfp pilus assembly protein PilV